MRIVNTPCSLPAACVAALLCVMSLTAGCVTPQESARRADARVRSTPLVIDVDPASEISGVVRAVFEDSRGTIWWGGECDLFRNDGRTLTNYAIKDDLGRGVTIKEIVEDKDGNIWFGTTHGGISRFDGIAFTNFTELGIVEGKEIWCMHEGRTGDIWISGKRSPMYRYDGHAFTRVPDQDEVTTLAFAILEDSGGRVWLGGTNGLFRRDGESFVKVTKDGPWR